MIDSEIMAVTDVSGTTWTITRGLEGTTAATHSSAAAVTHLLTADSLANLLGHTSAGWSPNSAGYLAWNGEPIFMGVSQISMATQAFTAAKIPIFGNVTVSNISFQVSTAGATPTANQNFVALYAANATLSSSALLGNSTAGVLDSVITSTGRKKVALSSPVTLTGGPNAYVWALVLFNGGTAPKLASGPSSLNGPYNVDQFTGRSVNSTGANTTPPSTLGATSFNNLIPWFALS
jgi:hypothetical protein